MPYTLKGNAVYVVKNGRRKLLKRYTGKNARARALAYFRALKINVRS